MLEFKPDYEACKKRIDAWWRGELLDKPPTYITIPRKKPLIPLPKSHHADTLSRWYDFDYQSDLALAKCANTLYLGDAMPTTWPNLGPEIFSAFFGCEMRYTENTAWSEPILEDWNQMPHIRFDPENFYFKKVMEYTDALIEKGRGRFITGITDLHPGGDHLAALREPQRLAIDVLECPERIKEALAQTEEDFFRVYDLFYEKLRAACQPITTWTPMIAAGKFYVPSNDFSCMISKRQFDDIFLPWLERECRFLDHSIYHLDGPGALRHLDSLLGIDELDAIQWVAGAGKEGFQHWIHLYQRIQDAGKGIELRVNIRDMDMVFETLKPDGLWMLVSGVKSVDEADAALRRIARWR